MDLRFPLARLYVYNRLHGGEQGCADALVGAAYDTRVISEGSLDDWLSEFGQGGSGGCSSIIAAKKIIERRVSQEHRERSEEERIALIDKITRELDKRLLEYQMSLCDPDSHPDEAAARKACANLSPVIIDILLQQLQVHD